MRDEERTREELLLALNELHHQVAKQNTIILSHNETEKALHETNEKLRLAADCTADFIWEWNIRTGELVWFGPIDNILGYESGAFPRTIDAWKSIVHHDDQDRVITALNHHLENRTPLYDTEYRVLKKDGSVLMWMDRGCAVWNQDNDPVKMVGAVTDITSRKEIEDALRASEERFRILIESLPIGIFTYKGTKIHYLNPACEKITGYTQEELHQIDLWKVIHPEFHETAQEFMRKRQRGEPVPELYELKFITKSGEVRWCERGAITIEQKEDPLVLATVIDITERKRTEETVRKSEEKYRALLKNASDAIILADIEGYFVEVNWRACELLGYTGEELVGKHYTELHPTREHERTIDIFNTMVTHGYGVLQDGQIICKNGDILYTDITGSLIEYGGAKYIQGSFRDVSEKVYLQKTLEKAVKERTAELSEKNTQLENEIKERIHSETLLKESSKKLNRYTAKLEEFNVALKVFLTERENVRADMEEKVLTNIKYHMSPNLEKLKKRIQKKDNKALLEIIQASLKNVTSSFSQRLSSKALHLTPSEIKIANMIRDGRTTKEIAGYMGVSTNAINHHRYHIRKKLGIASQKISLRAHLLSIPN